MYQHLRYASLKIRLAYMYRSFKLLSIIISEINILRKQ